LKKGKRELVSGTSTIRYDKVGGGTRIFADCKERNEKKNCISAHFRWRRGVFPGQVEKFAGEGESPKKESGCVLGSL
jgi:hypothetical protein